MFARILVATDGSDHADKATGLAAQLAAGTGAALTIMHVLQAGPIAEELRHMAEIEHLTEPDEELGPRLRGMPSWMGGAIRAGVGAGSDRRIAEAIGHQILERAERIAAEAGVKKVSTLIEDGDPTRRILERAKSDGMDAIFVGARGLSDVAGLMLGSVSHKVSQLATCTCVTVK